MNKILLCLVVLISLAGCTPTASIQSISDSNAKIATQSTLEMTCPPRGCVIGNFKYTDPRDRHYQEMPHDFADVLMHMGDKVLDIAGGAVPFVAIGSVANSAIKNAGHNVTTTTTTTTTNTASGAGASTGGAAAYNQIGPDSANQANPSTTTTTTDNHASTTDNHASTTDNHAVDNTATPTVVNQPAPPAPVVITPSTGFTVSP